MKKKFILPFIFILLVNSLIAQDERIYENYVSTYDMQEFYRKNPGIVGKVFTKTGEIRNNEAIIAGWGSFSEVFGLESMPMGFIGEVFNPAALKSINTMMGNVGIGLVLSQLIVDVYNKDYSKGAMNFSKSAAFIAIGNWGWKTLKVASYGLMFLDYSMTKFGQTAVNARKGAWADAYNNYYNDTGGGKLNLAKWKDMFMEARSDKDIEAIINNHITKFWNESFRDTYRKKKTVGFGYPSAEATPKEKKEIQEAFLKYNLLPYLTALFNKMPEIIEKDKLKELKSEYVKVRNELNRTNTVVVYAKSQLGIFDDTKMYIEANMDGKIKPFMKLKADTAGYGYFEFTRYSLLKHKVKKEAKLVINCKVKSKEYKLKLDLDLSKKQNFINYEIPIHENDTANAENLNDHVDNGLDFKDNVEGVFTIQRRPMDVVIKKTNETETHFYGQIIRKGFFKANQIIYNKKKNELSITYQLDGRRAPQLICIPENFNDGLFVGRIETNDKHHVKVGKFSFKLK